MEIKMDDVEQVREKTGATYKRAKEALEKANCSVIDAIIDIEGDTENTADDIIEKIKEFVKKGNITRVLIKRNGETLLNIPMNVGIVGGLLGAAVAPWGVIAGVIIAYGCDCRIELEKNDGSTFTIDE